MWQRYRCRRGRHTWVPQIAYSNLAPFGPLMAGTALSCRWCHLMDWTAWRSASNPAVREPR